jgi:hypothetical protein
VGRPEGAERLVGAAAGVLLEGGHGVLGRFVALVAMFGGDEVEPAGGDRPEWLGYFEVGRLGVGDVAGTGVMGGMGAWNNGGYLIIVSRHGLVSLAGAAPAVERRAVCPL